MGTPLAPAPLVSAFRRAKDVYFSGGEITIIQIALLRLYFKRVIEGEPKAERLRQDIERIHDRAAIARWIEQARASGVSVFQNREHG